VLTNVEQDLIDLFKVDDAYLRHAATPEILE